MSEEYDYKKKLRLFELDMLKKGHKFMNIPDAIAPELRDECYSSDFDKTELAYSLMSKPASRVESPAIYERNFWMTNKDKNVLANICKQSKNFAEVLLESHDKCIKCSLSTLRKYWKIFGKKEQKDE